MTASDLVLRRGGDYTAEYDADVASGAISTQLPHAIIAVDPGLSYGIAVAYHGRMVRASSGPRAKRLDAAICERVQIEIRRAWEETGALPLVVVEDTWLARGAGANVSSMASVARCVGAVIATAALEGCASWRVHPVTWRSRVLGGRPTRERGKALALAIASATLPGAHTEHTADAVCLALYVSRLAHSVAPSVKGKAT